MLKREELSKPNSCLNRAASDEPIFTLRAKDPHAAQTLRHWAAMSEGTHEPEKIEEALTLAYQMEAWRKSRFDDEGRPHPEVAQATPLQPRTKSG